MSDPMPPMTAVAVLRAKAAQLENEVLDAPEDEIGMAAELTMLRADVALAFGLLAETIERTMPPAPLAGAIGPEPMPEPEPDH